MFRTHSGACHPRVTVGIGEINISIDKNVLVIRGASCQNKRAQDQNFDRDEDDAGGSLHKIDNRKSAIENRK
jgi:hypothetical protein